MEGPWVQETGVDGVPEAALKARQYRSALHLFLTLASRVNLRIQTRSLPFPPCTSFFHKSALRVHGDDDIAALQLNFMRCSGASAGGCGAVLVPVI
ncbi:hypothetical protein [Paraburkholderia sp. SIMBA_030]|uniref:hypothetical protein n=1 Tax=Paraburkholderia sp. SIMBA_030 TaxID=3085773 RepID=UPI00397CD6B3